jgi:phage-related holin
MQTNGTGEWVYVLWVAVALLATLFLKALLRARVAKEVRYQQARNGVVYVLLATAAVYAAYLVMGA